MSYLQGTLDRTEKKSAETFPIPGSSFLQAASFDPQSSSLTLDFKNGTQTIHQNFSAMSWQQFKEQQSHGSFYARQIKGKYPAFSSRSGLKVSDFTRAIKENRHAPN